MCSSDLNTYSRDIIWNLSNTNAVNEIPEWAYYYSIVRTKCLSTSAFMQWRGGMTYIYKDNVTGDLSSSDSLTGIPYGLGISVDDLVSFGMGYTYKEDDTVRLYRSTGGTPYVLNVKGVFSNYIIVDFVNFGTTTGLVNLYELDTPYIKSEQEFYYELGNMYGVYFPETPLRK